jgi:outer membrane protein OmpA-like peptidoglycan-associated protein
MVGVMALLMTPDLSSAQGIRPEDTFFIKPRVGIAWHLGDTESSPFNFNMDNWKVDGKFPWAAGLELGYQFNQSTSLSLGAQVTNHPLLFHYGESAEAAEATSGIPVEDDGTVATSIQLMARFAGTGRIAPFFGIGGNVTFGQDGRQQDPGFGPAIALGLDIVLSDRISLVVENTSSMTFPDDAMDGWEGSEPEFVATFGKENDFLPFDVLNALTLGLKINFKSAFTPVEILSVDCVGALQTGQTGTFAATVNADATQPVSYTWNFGDGTTASGLRVTHSFAQPGTYTVTVTASNARSSDSATCTVTVTAPPVAAEIISLTANPMTFEVCAPVTVTFNANVRGDQPVTYSWNFGDGTTGTGATATHTYSEPGSYTVTLTVSNAAGSDTRSITLTAEPCETICDDITELNSVFFDRNSSTLTAEARAALQENLEILLECPNICVRIEGFAGPGERNPQRLSEDRARAVMQFYIDNGVAASRLMAVGRGLTGAGGKGKGDQASNRRADSIPVPCEDLNR